MCGNAAFIAQNGPITFMSQACSIAESGILSTRLSPAWSPPHALFTRMSRRPHRSTAAATAASLSACWVASVCRKTASVPKSRVSSSATAAPLSSLISATTTRAPSWA